MGYTWLIFDLIALVLIILMIRYSASRGFLRTVLGFLGAVLSAVAANALSLPAARFLYNAIVRDILRAVISRRVESAFEEGLPGGDWLSALPDWAARMLPPGAEAAAPDITGNIMPIIEQLLDSMLAEPVTTLLRGACFFVFFAVFMRTVRYIAKLTGLIDRIPMVGSFNTWLGGILGVGQALIILYLLALVTNVYITATGGGEYINAENLSDGYIFGFFYRLI
jgi:uncharacterized membrane protein required for colicin V production